MWKSWIRSSDWKSPQKLYFNTPTSKDGFSAQDTLGVKMLHQGCCDCSYKRKKHVYNLSPAERGVQVRPAIFLLRLDGFICGFFFSRLNTFKLLWFIFTINSWIHIKPLIKHIWNLNNSREELDEMMGSVWAISLVKDLKSAITASHNRINVSSRIKTLTTGITDIISVFMERKKKQ